MSCCISPHVLLHTTHDEKVVAGPLAVLSFLATAGPKVVSSLVHPSLSISLSISLTWIPEGTTHCRQKQLSFDSHCPEHAEENLLQGVSDQL